MKYDDNDDYAFNHNKVSSGRPPHHHHHHPENNAGVIAAAIIVAIVLAILGWFFFNGKDDSPARTKHSVEETIKGAGSKAKDAAVEVPRAASDAVTKGDQPTTRPNKNDSTDKLDQKP